MLRKGDRAGERKEVKNKEMGVREKEAKMAVQKRQKEITEEKNLRKSVSSLIIIVSTHV